jgi:hypothetical protein
MDLLNWNNFATGCIRSIRNRSDMPARGALLIPSPSDNCLYAVVFANDHAVSVEQGQREASLIAERLRSQSVEDLGFSHSTDGQTWALVVRVWGPPLRTQTGRRFFLELTKIRLEEAVLEAGRALRQDADAMLASTF